MSLSAARLSIKSIMIWLVIVVSGSAMLLSTLVTNYLQHAEVKEQLLQNVRSLADMVASNVRPIMAITPTDIDEEMNRSDQLANMLHGLDSFPDVLNAHIYSAPINGQTPQMLALYTRSTSTAAESKINDLARYFTARLDEDNQVIEIIRPINIEEQTLGYVYVRMSSESFFSYVSGTRMVQVATIVLIIIAAFLVALKYGQMLANPIQDTNLMLQKVARSRDYSLRFSASNVREYDHMLDSINILLSRVEEYISKQQQAERELQTLNSRLEEEVNQRTVALKSANNELIQTLEKLHQFQRQIVENEKMASLGDMVAGVAHEVNTPIGLGITASTMMLDRLAVIDQQFKDKTLKASAMERFINESRENLNIIYRNLDRAAQLISSFKQVAVDQTSEEAREVNVKQLIEETLMSMRPRLKKVTHTINIDCPETLNVMCKAGPLNQILINLIMNSLIHAFETVENGKIDVIARLTDDQKLKIIYKDNGSGIPTSIKKRIFDPFVTTKRGQGGSGLGMHLVFNLVTQALNGNIKLESEEGNGVEFTLTFPVTVKKP
ncbi:MAG TPA: HAMP domain-containing histidine kinase [Alteromonas sp.]|jgi:signal transduction histidine kinase|nr:HAMP domain-containing histidine kinase [Alteromonas sp.]HCB08258.1 HAMP domain-containing histidine kinase [Alteromonas sp.]HCL11373.1 HAMP domain-containing histidine kinase [Alteromonas sp.]HCV19418.1 HAMP domain-containing histidine kinase [Alteromonas sp.]|tara:strand:+ start:3024 stop:4682 length:1659 start_codon:yes stop_codon:yes gene_type:complete